MYLFTSERLTIISEDIFLIYFLYFITVQRSWSNKKNIFKQKTLLFNSIFVYQVHCLGAGLLLPERLSSALVDLTTVFEKGTGVPPPLKAPRHYT